MECFNIKYGLSIEKSIDITDEVMKECFRGTILFINKNISFNNFKGDPYVNIIKKLFINVTYDNKIKKFEFNEYRNDDIHINFLSVIEKITRPLNDLISVILPTLNRYDKFKNTVLNFLNQTYDNFELIIIDDGSEEYVCKDKEDFVNNLNDNRIIFIKNNENLKISKTLNKGLKISKGEYITWISDDNEYYSNFLINLIDTNYDYIYSYYHLQTYNNDTPISIRFEINIEYNNIYELLIPKDGGKWEGSASFMWRSSFLKELYGWEENYNGIEDYEIIFKTFLYTRSIKVVKQYAMCYIIWSYENINQNYLYAPGVLENNAILYDKIKNYYYENLYINGKYPNSSSFNLPLKIPKIAFTFWYGEEFTYLHYLSIETFCFYNKDYEYIIYTIKDCVKDHKWIDGELGLKITCENYFNKINILQQIYNIKIIYLDDNYSYKNYCANIISDFIRWTKLYEHGGIWTDLDILYLKPIEYIFTNIQKKCDFDNLEFIISEYKNVNGIEGWTEWFPAGVILASKNNKICENFTKLMYDAYDPKVYNSVGPNLVKENFKNFDYYFNNYENVGLFQPELIYPYVWYQTDDYFKNYNIVKKETVGLHWYNGHPNSRSYLNNIHTFLDNDKCFLRNNYSCIEIYIKNFLKIKSNSLKTYIICMVIDSYGWALNTNATNIKKYLNNNLIYIYTTAELIIEIKNNDLDIKHIDLFLLLNSYDTNVLSTKETLVNLLPNEKIVHMICDYSCWINNPDISITDVSRKMLLDTYNHSKITLITCKIIEKYLGDIGIFPKNIIEFNNVIDNELFKFNIYKDSIYFKHKLVIGWVGNASPYCHGWLKGLDIIKKIITKNFDKFEFVYHNKYEGNDIEYNQIPNFYKNIDLYVCFSKYEGVPLTLLEASSSGRAWVSSDVGIATKILEYGKCGIVINRDEKYLEEILIHLYHNRSEIVKMGQEGRIIMEKYFNGNIITNNLFNSIFNILNY